MHTGTDVISPPWKIGIDIGGTFTDAVLVDAHGREVLHKVPSNPSDPAAALLAAWGELAAKIGVSAQELAENCSRFIHGTTIATNILLERNGARSALLTTSGFRDSLEFRRGVRRNVWDHRTPWEDPLIPRRLRIGIAERVSADGEVLQCVSEEDLDRALEIANANGVEAIGICFLNSYRNSENEAAAEEYLRNRSPSLFISTSSQVAPVLGEYERSSTVAVNCYIAPKVIPYIDSIRQELRSLGYKSEPYFVQSSGGTISFEHLKQRPAVLALSGPAAGANALVKYAQRVDQPTLISVEIGGTSCDMTIVHEGSVAEQSQFRVGDEVIALPSVDIQTIAVAGGTVAAVDGCGMLQLGPQSAGARPGPAAFGLGGTRPTVTDAQLVLGRLKAGRYAGGKIALQEGLAAEAIQEHIAEPLGLSTREAAAAIVRLTEQRIRNAVERLCFDRGLDPTGIVLLAGGGAGPMHVFGIARALGCRQILIPRVAGVLCAYGMCHAEIRHDLVSDLGFMLGRAGALDQLEDAFGKLYVQALDLMNVDGIVEADIDVSYFVEARYRGQTRGLRVGVRKNNLTYDALLSGFETVHERQFGFIQPGGQVELINARVVTSSRTTKDVGTSRPVQVDCPTALETREVWVDVDHGFQSLPVYDSANLGNGSEIKGPCIIDSSSATTFIGCNAQVRVDESVNLHIKLEVE